MENLFSYLAFFFFVILIIKLLYQYPNPNLPPSPFSLPIIGHFHLLKQPVYQSLKTLSLKYGPVLFLKFGSRPVLVVSSPSMVEECFAKNDIIFANRPRTMAGDILTYNSIVVAWTPYGHLWRNLRRIVNLHIFSKKSLQNFSIIREEEVYSLLRMVFKVSKRDPQKVEFRYFSSLLMFNVIMRMVTGKPCVGEEAASTDLGKQQLKDIKGIIFAFLSMNICDHFPILRRVGYKGLEKSMVRLQWKRDRFLTNLIEEIKQMKTSHSKNEKRTLIESLLSLHDSESEFYSDVVVKSIVLVMFTAGTDTTATTMEWAMSLLLNHPEVLQKVKAEIVNQVGHGRLLNDSDLDKLPYLRSVVNETLRLYPPTPLLLPHCSAEDCSVGGYTVPKGTTLLANAWAVHRDPKQWEEPNNFKPERFEGFNGEREGFRFIPFGIGRRVCPGAGMAQRVILLALGGLIQCFDWERLDKEMVDMNPASGYLLSKEKPLEALCSPTHSMENLLSQH
ncbi:cytochrome P450 81C13-like [Juglans microcarpa x Juglans regia]|uniref:cytochrome P450 81C13-like n=1 Tax=Juglans microcarpa x Juglans regia TaxID=2249226 RepID=UPI001B7E1EB9|nr:cytochrome P450 81C13-like [Juglans microcarpa x Juglans regia]